MAKIQKLMMRIEKDDRMCLKINEYLDSVNRGEISEPFAIGAIMSCLEIAGRREKGEECEKRICKL